MMSSSMDAFRSIHCHGCGGSCGTSRHPFVLSRQPEKRHHSTCHRTKPDEPLCTGPLRCYFPYRASHAGASESERWPETIPNINILCNTPAGAADLELVKHE